MARNSGEFDNVDSTTILDIDDIEDVMKEVSDLGAHFYEFGSALGVRAPDLDQINKENSECGMKLRKIVQKCLMQQYKVQKFGPPTWKKIVLAADQSNHALALRIARNHSAASPHPSDQLQSQHPASPTGFSQPPHTTVPNLGYALQSPGQPHPSYSAQPHGTIFEGSTGSTGSTVAPNLQEIIAHAGISVVSLNQICDPNDPAVLQKLADCCDPIRMIGFHLKLTKQEINDIVRENQFSAEEQRLALLQKWQDKFTHKATYLMLVQALVNCGKNKQAANACKIIAESFPTAQQQAAMPPHPSYYDYGQSSVPGRESQPSYHPPAETTRAVSIHHGVPPTSGKPPEPEPYLPDQGYVPSDQCGEYLSASTGNIQTVYKHWKLADIHKNGITGKGITIAIIDDGLDCSHDSIKGKYDHGKIKGFPKNWNHDQAEHGTAVVAIATGYPYHNKSGGYVPSGIAPGAELYIYRLGKNFTSGENEMSAVTELSAALEHILNLPQRIDVVAMSICLPKANPTIRDQLEKLAKKKIVCIAAAGNSSFFTHGAKFPANDNNVISVGALEDTGQKAPFTPDSGIDVYAFGKNVLVPSVKHAEDNATPDNATPRNATKYIDGTSFAVPMVAGFLALLFDCAKTFPNCEGIYDAYHDMYFLKQHFIECHKLCSSKRLRYVSSYFEDLWENRMNDNPQLVKDYEKLIQQ